ncbi:hypothetical protein BR93DRAFT_552367 [Coniochaeta sp. PMI_546]|nr:hypothetical protein BR93DRAFT_552367 [Coniochaeta sp. PMI_546]
MGVPIPSDGDSETSETSDDASEASLSNDSLANTPAVSRIDQSSPRFQQTVTTEQASYDPITTDGAGFGETRPKLVRSDFGHGASSSQLGKSPDLTQVQQPESSSSPSPPGHIKPFSRSTASPAPAKTGKASPGTRLVNSQAGSQASDSEPVQKGGRSPRLFKASSTQPFHKLIHSGRKKDWNAPVPTDPPGPEDADVPWQEKFSVDARVLLPGVLRIFEDKPKPARNKNRRIVAGGSTSGAGTDEDGSSDNGRLESKGKRTGKTLARGSDGDGSTTSRSATGRDATEPTRRSNRKRRKVKAKRESNPAEIQRLPPALTPNGQSRQPGKNESKVAHFEAKQEDNDYHPRGASLDLEPIPEDKPLRFPRSRRGGVAAETSDYDPCDPLLTWYFPRKSPDYWEMLDDVAKMFEDLQLQEVTLKHFQRPIDYVTVLLCLSNVVFAEMFQTLQEKVTDGQYRIEFVASGRTGFKLYLSAYSREHTYIAKSLMHKVNAQLDVARKHSPRSTIQYIHLIECVERVLVHDKRKSWGRIPDGVYSTWTDIDSPAVIHEVGIGESRAELYRRSKRYLQDIASVNLVVAVKVDSTECEWAELLVLARDPADDRICKVFNWVRFWGEGAVNGGDLRYYPSDFLEIEDRWKIPLVHMRPLDILDGPRCPIVKISFGELGRMVSLTKWENQALMGYIKKYGPFQIDFPL